jgi:hypothetical protein
VKRRIGRWIGVSHRVGQAMCYWILPKSAEPISRSTIQALTPDELKTPEVLEQLHAYDERVNERLARGDNDLPDLGVPIERDLYSESHEMQAQEEDAVKLDIEDYDPETYDTFLQAEVILPLGDTMQTARVTKQKRDDRGNPIGKANANPMLDQRIYEAEFPDGTVKEYSANAIAEAIYSQVDDEGKQYLLMDTIIDHERSDGALKLEDLYLDNQKGNLSMRKTTKGWKLLVQWKDGTTTWISLKDLKESNPLQVAEYAVSNNIASEPAFVWWVKDVLRKRDRIISKVKSKYWKRTHKFGIQVPKSVKEALQIDKETGTTFWRDAILKEMKNVMPAFKILEADEEVPIGYQHIRCHMIFDIKMDFTRKARFVAGGPHD